MKAYYTKIEFKNRIFEIGIRPKDVGFDLELYFKGSLSGDDYQGLRNYLIEEGYVDAAVAFLSEANNYGVTNS